MKKLLALCSLFLVTASVCLAGDQDFTVINKTGVGFKKLYVSPHNTEDWEENLLKEPLANGETFDISFEPKTKAKLWDLRVEDSKGNALEWENLNLLEVSKVTLHWDGKKGTADVE